MTKLFLEHSKHIDYFGKSEVIVSDEILGKFLREFDLMIDGNNIVNSSSFYIVGKTWRL